MVGIEVKNIGRQKPRVEPLSDGCDREVAIYLFLSFL